MYLHCEELDQPFCLLGWVADPDTVGTFTLQGKAGSTAHRPGYPREDQADLLGHR